MISPSFLEPDEDVTVLGKVFGTPLVIKGRSWLPVAELLVWVGTTFWAGAIRPARSWGERMRIGALWMPLVLGMEWCHNLAHAAAARWVGKPMDALLINYGTPLCIYHDIEDPSVSPWQHICRALGGPIFNALTLPVLAVLGRVTRPGTLVRDTIQVLFETNVFLSTVAFVPLPWLDGGPIIKWSLVRRGRTPRQAEATLKKINGVAGLGMLGGARAAFRRGNRFFGLVLVQLALMAVGYSLGLIVEKRRETT